MPEHYRNYIKANKSDALIWIGVFGKNGYIKDLNPPVTLTDLLQGPVEINMPHELSPGNYYLRFTINVPKTIPTHNSDKITMVVN